MVAIDQIRWGEEQYKERGVKETALLPITDAWGDSAMPYHRAADLNTKDTLKT